MIDGLKAKVSGRDLLDMLRASTLGTSKVLEEVKRLYDEHKPTHEGDSCHMLDSLEQARFRLEGRIDLLKFFQQGIDLSEDYLLSPKEYELVTFVPPKPEVQGHNPLADMLKSVFAQAPNDEKPS